jgi:hypothetical protein
MSALLFWLLFGCAIFLVSDTIISVCAAWQQKTPKFDNFSEQDFVDTKHVDRYFGDVFNEALLDWFLICVIAVIADSDKNSVKNMSELISVHVAVDISKRDTIC